MARPRAPLRASSLREREEGEEGEEGPSRAGERCPGTGGRDADGT